jgi:hypothetical protein
MTDRLAMRGASDRVRAGAAPELDGRLDSG